MRNEKGGGGHKGVWPDPCVRVSREHPPRQAAQPRGSEPSKSKKGIPVGEQPREGRQSWGQVRWHRHRRAARPAGADARGGEGASRGGSRLGSAVSAHTGEGSRHAGGRPWEALGGCAHRALGSRRSEAGTPGDAARCRAGGQRGESLMRTFT